MENDPEAAKAFLRSRGYDVPEPLNMETATASSGKGLPERADPYKKNPVVTSDGIHEIKIQPQKTRASVMFVDTSSDRSTLNRAFGHIVISAKGKVHNITPTGTTIINREAYINSVTNPHGSKPAQGIVEFEIELSEEEVVRLEKHIQEPHTYDILTHNCAACSNEALAKATKGSKIPIPENPGIKKSPTTPADVVNNLVHGSSKKRVVKVNTYLPKTPDGSIRKINRTGWAF